MRVQRVTITRKISPDGLLPLDSLEISEFARQHPGRSTVIRVELLPIPPSDKSFAYYWKVVVPTVQRGFYDTGENLTPEQTDRRIRELSPVCYVTEYDVAAKKVRTRIKELDEMDAAELNEMIEQFKQYAAETLFVYIEEPQFV